MLSEIKSSREGLLSISMNLLQKLVRKDPISEAYDVEETPFARLAFYLIHMALMPLSRQF